MAGPRFGNHYVDGETAPERRGPEGRSLATTIEVVEASPQSGVRAYYPRLDVVRVAAAVSIVVLHSADASLGSQHASDLALTVMRDLSLWAMPFFVAAAGFLHGKSATPGSVDWLAHRARRLLPLYVLWSVAAQGWVQLGLQPSPGSLRQVLEEALLGWQHLWYIPMIIVCAIPVWWVSRTPEREQRLHAPLWALSVVLCIGYLAAAAALKPSPSLIYYLYRSPGYWFFFYASGWLLGRGHVRLTERTHLVAGPAMFIAIVLLVGPILWGWPATLAYAGAGLAAIAVLSLAARRQGNPTETINTLARATFGVYLLHPFVLVAVFRLMHIGFSGPVSVSYAAAAAIGACIVSFSAVVMCSRWRVGRFVFGWRRVQVPPPGARAVFPGRPTGTAAPPTSRTLSRSS
jgi:surface polysaccharide O-acyltransferase-like enzyme